MPLRITQNSMNRTQLAGLNNSLARLQQTQEQLTSGKKLNRPSDNPVDTVSAMRLRSEQRQLEQFGENISDGLSRLQTGDDALNRATQMVQRIRTITVAASNGTLGQSERNAYAEEVSELKNGLIQLANSQYAGRPVFAGTANVDNAFDPMSGAYQGNKLPILRVVSDAPGAAGQVNVAVPGDDIFQVGGANYFTDHVGRLVDGLRENDFAKIQLELGHADGILDNIGSAQSTIGARTNRLQSLQELNGRQDDASRVALSKVEDVDFIKAAMDLNIQSTAYNAALQASAKILQPSLMDFLR